MMMEELIRSLSSSALDASPRKKRQELFHLALQQFLEGDYVLPDVPTCRSKHACERIIKLYLEVLLLQRTTTTTANHHDSISDPTTPLLKALCNVLVQSKSPELVSMTGKKLKKQIIMSGNSADYTTILKDLACSSPVIVFGPAVTLGRMLLSSGNDDETTTTTEEQKTELLNIGLLQKTLGLSSLSSDNETTTLLLSNLSVSFGIISQDEWDTLVCPLILKKLKSSPETFLEMISIFITTCLESNVRIIKKKQEQEEEGELTSLLMKQLKSSKPNIRSLAQETLIEVAKREDDDDASSCYSTAIQVATIGLSSLSVPDQRIGVYHALKEMAIATATTNNNNSDAPSRVLCGIVAILQKETKTATIAKDAGLNALMAWIRVTKRCMGGTCTKGYEEALDYLIQPLLIVVSSSSSSKINGQDVVHRWGYGLFQSLDNSHDLQESILVDAMNHSKKRMERGLVSLLENVVVVASKKKVPTVASCQEGLLAIYLLLLHAVATKSTILNPTVEKILKTGSLSSSSSFNKKTTTSSSFLFGTTMLLEALPNMKTTPLVSILLPRCITLYVKWMQTTHEVSTNYFKNSSTVACQAMAWCILFPSTSPSTTTSTTETMMLSHISTLLMYDNDASTTASNLLNALMECVNRRSCLYEEMEQEQHATREAREQYEPVVVGMTTTTTSTMWKGKFSPTGWCHSGMDTCTVRNVAKKLGMALKWKNDASSSSSMTCALILMHLGTSSRRYKQRTRLMDTTVQVWMQQQQREQSDEEQEESLLKSMAETVAMYSSSSMALSGTKQQQQDDDEQQQQQQDISTHVHRACISFISTMGNIGCLYDPTTMVMEEEDEEEDAERPNRLARKFCVTYLSHQLSTRLELALKDVQESLTEEDLNLYKSPKDRPYKKKKNNTDDAADDGELMLDKKTTTTSAKTKRAGGKSRRNKGGGDFGNTFEDEEWEREMKKELAAKKKKEQQQQQSSSTPLLLSPQDKELLVKQQLERKRIHITLCCFERYLNTIQSLCLSDIEIGNSCLPILSNVIMNASITLESTIPTTTRTTRTRMYSNNNNNKSLKDYSMETLSVLASCVYEMDETFASTIARALCICCCKKKTTTSFSKEEQQVEWTIVPFPSPCPSASTILTEMEEYGDKFCGPSFVFLFPILQAALIGPRTTPGCEGALRILGAHTCMMVTSEDDDLDENVVVKLRKDMVTAILALLSHDRAQTFVHPTPYEVLVDCYATNDENSSSFSTAEIAPLLDERGALSINHHCRIGAMMAAEAIIASKQQQHSNLVKKNPLFENRIWVNCFDSNIAVRDAARKAWMVAKGGESNSNNNNNDELLPPPSPVYSIPLLPLLSSSNESIALAAAVANATAMGMHPSSIQRNLLKLCSTYVDSYPTSFVGGDPSKKEEEGKALPSALPSKKKPVATTTPTTAVAPKKKKATISTGLKKKTTKKSALDIAGIGKASSSSSKAKGKKKTSAASKAATAALLKPKEERTFDRSILENQFKSSATTSSSEKRNNVPEEKDSEVKIGIRRGMLQALAATTTTQISLDLPCLQLTTGFLMAYGLADGNDGVREAARNTLRDVVATNGDSEQAISFLLPNLERVLENGIVDDSVLGTLPTEKVPRDVAASDRRKEGAVVALGAVALHLKGAENEDKVDSTVDMLLSTLSTPSEGVQKSVADCLVKLMKKGRTQSRLESILSDLLRNCLNGDTLALRRGSAYGLAAAVKGSGIGSLKKFEVVKKLEAALDTGSSTNKEGALYGIELLSARLGLLFEPYVIVLLPALLKSFSDGSDYVRSAASHTAGLIMSKLSAHGVKLVMPAVLKAFEDPAWRTKQASILMLGTMSHCAPKQLASALPKVVPKLTEAFTDTHPKVKASAEEALQEISKVVKNPEISSISKTLLTALTEPSEGTVLALEALIETEFLHAIDAPSLALIVPILHRGLRDRVASTKRFGALIAGNICTMINDPKDFVPYLPILLPDLKTSLLDPIPDVRSTSAKALGSLTRGLGEESLPDLRSWLVDKLREESITSAERSGAAHGLSEVLIAGGAGLVEEVMIDEILPLRSHPQAATREGVLWVISFLPSALGQTFTPLIDESLPALIGGLSDDSEPVRDVAMRAGRVLIRSLGKVHFDKILPSLEAGFNDDDYRIRVASLTLLGDLLSMIGGTSVVKGDGDTQEDIRKAERAQAQIALTLGARTRKRVLGGLYLARSDTTAVVRQSAVQVWKTVVSVTARTLRDILPVLVELIVEALASGHAEKTQVAGRCLGDIVSKLGESVLPEIIPVLRNALYSGDENTRRGVCVGLSEVISFSTRDQLTHYIDIIVKAVQDALCDEDAGVREMGAACFQSLHNVVGNRALDEIVPSLLVALEHGSDETKRSRALNGLTGILSIRSRELLPYIIPRLIKSPISKNHADALGGIAEVTGATLHMHFATIIPAMISELASFHNDDEDDDDEEREEALRNCCRSICHHVEEGGVNWLLSEIASKCGNDKAEIRCESCFMLQVVVEERQEEADFYSQLPIMLRELVYRLIDEDTRVLKSGNNAFTALSKHVPAEELVKNIEFIRNLIASMVSDARRRKGGVGDGEFLMPGFNMPKGLDPLLPIYSEGILYGSPNIREVSASGLGELIALTSSKYLAGKLVVKMVGPLLRIVGDRNPSEVKIAILKTLGMVLVKGGPALRAFVPQFQTTFVKALSDSSRQVRLEAIGALGLLMPLSTRVDPLMKELVAGSRGKDGSSVAAVQTATLEALAVVIAKGGKKAKLKESIPTALDASKDLILHEDEGVREAAAKVMGNSCALLGKETTAEVLQDSLLTSSGEKIGERRHGKACALHRIFVAAGSSVADERDEVMDKLLEYTNDDKSSVREAAFVALGAVVGSADDPSEQLSRVEPVLLTTMKKKKESMEIHKAAARGLCYLCTLSSSMVEGDKVTLLGKSLMDASLELAMSGSQRVQFAFNDALWLALDVENGEEGLEAYNNIASFDNTKSMKSLFTKVLSRMKEVSMD